MPLTVLPGMFARRVSTISVTDPPATGEMEAGLD